MPHVSGDLRSRAQRLRGAHLQPRRSGPTAPQTVASSHPGGGWQSATSSSSAATSGSSWSAQTPAGANQQRVLALPGPVRTDYLPHDPPQYHWHQDTHYHYHPAVQPAQASGRAFPSTQLVPTMPSPPQLTRSGGCLVVFLVLLGAFLTFAVMLMGLALAGQILTLR